MICSYPLYFWELVAGPTKNDSQDTFNWAKRFNLIYTTFAAIGFSPISPRYSLSIKDCCVCLYESFTQDALYFHFILYYIKFAVCVFWSGWRESDPLKSPWKGDAPTVMRHPQNLRLITRSLFGIMINNINRNFNLMGCWGNAPLVQLPLCFWTEVLQTSERETTQMTDFFKTHF